MSGTECVGRMVDLFGEERRGNGPEEGRRETYGESKSTHGSGGGTPCQEFP